MMRFIDFINKDVISENETKRGMVSLRILYLAVFVAFLLDTLFAGFEAVKTYPVRIGVFFALIICLFIQTYYAKTRTSMSCFVIFIIAWIFFMIPCFGWSAGMQNYFIVILMLSFFAVHAPTLFKFILASAVLAVRIVTIFILGGTKAGVEISPLTDKLIQITNISAVFISIILISYIFSRDDNEAESKLMKFNDLLIRQASTDPLTGLFNRRRSVDYMGRIIKSAEYASISVAIGDIDFFKKVNDTYGHDAGDEVLRFVADKIKEHCSTDAFIARWGGEEFLVVFPGKNGDESFTILEDLRTDVMNSSINVKGQEIKVTMTFGLTEYDFGGDINHTIKEADTKLYTGKESGRNHVVY
ncbi:MAG: GGDEF domain-containing protein [Eubacterium sp.]|nr:GGDEF domain-containing protein [Eubacterium sp.]